MKFAVLFLFMVTAAVCVANQCGSCGSECASACGTRRFRACCFNYLRRKRGDAVKLWMPHTKDMKKEELEKMTKLFLTSILDSWFDINENKPYNADFEAENHIHNVF